MLCVCVCVCINTYICTWVSQVTLVIKNLPVNVGDASLIPRLRRCSEGEYGNTLQYSCLVNPMNRGAWQATVYRVTKSQT